MEVRKKTGWGGFDYNPYYNPEKCNLEIIDVTSKPDPCYDFHYVVLWREKDTGKLYWDEDSGCSCPSPFENVHSLSDLTDYAFTMGEYEDRKAKCARGEY